MEHKKIEKLKESLHFIESDTKNQHIIFVKNNEELEKFNPGKFFDTHPSLGLNVNLFN
jgi:hypothetical protein